MLNVLDCLFLQQKLFLLVHEATFQLIQEFGLGHAFVYMTVVCDNEEMNQG